MQAGKYTARDVLSKIEEGDVEGVQQILEGEPRLLNLSTPLGSWLHIATRNGQESIARLLVRMGIDVNVKGGPSGKSPLNVAAYEGNADLVSFYLKSGAKMDISEPDRNPLFAAIHGGHKHIAEILLRAGIDTEVRYTGRTMRDMDAIEFANEWGQDEIASIVRSYRKKKTT